MYRGKKYKKKEKSRPFLAHPAGGQETFFYLRMALFMYKQCGR